MSKKVFVDELVKVCKRYWFEIPDEINPEEIVDKLSKTNGKPLEIEDYDKGIVFMEAEYLDETEEHAAFSEICVFVPEKDGFKFIGSTK